MAASFPILPFQTQASSAATQVKAYSSALASGTLLFCITEQYSAGNTCSGVSDSVNGAWTQVLGPIGPLAATGNGKFYVFVFPNSAAGTPTVTATWSGSATGGLIIGAVAGLGGGGAVDVAFSGSTAGVTPYQIGPTAALAQAVEAAFAFFNTSTSPGAAPLSGWTADATPDFNFFDRTLRQITASTAALTAGWAETRTVSSNAVILTFKDAGGGGDTTAPVLTSPSGTGGVLGATGSVTTDEGNGTLYFWATTNASETAANIVANGDSQAVSATGAQAVDFGVLSVGTYYPHYVQDDAATNRSTAVHGASFAVTAPTGGTLAFQGAGLEFGARTGLAIDTFSLQNGASYKFQVYDDALTLGTPIHTSAAITLDGTGKLPDFTDAALDPATLYWVVAINQTTGERCIFSLESEP